MPDLRDRIKIKDDRQIVSVFVDDWQETVFVKKLGGRDRDKYEEDAVVTAKNGKRSVSMRDARARLVVLAAVQGQDDDRPLFEEKDVEWLTLKSACALDQLYEKAAELAGIRAKDEDEMLKNCEDAQSDGSGSN